MKRYINLSPEDKKKKENEDYIFVLTLGAGIAAGFALGWVTNKYCRNNKGCWLIFDPTWEVVQCSGCQSPPVFASIMPISDIVSMCITTLWTTT